MTETPATISSKPPKDAGLNYVALVQEGTHLVQRLSGAIWTDYNYSDPGVTILEQLCYALTELAYRADLSVPDLLGAPGSGEIVLPRQGLHAARTIMPVNPVTDDDLRRLIIDRVPEVANVWFTPLTADETGGVRGLYGVSVLTPTQDPCCEDQGPDPKEIRRRVLKVYGAHRALCEDVAAVVVLRPLVTEVRAAVQIDNHGDPDSILAEVFFNLGLVMAPEPRRHSLDAARAAGKTTAEIFDGPLMVRGFISGDQLGPLPRTIAVDDLQAAMAETRGVLSVDQLEVRVEGDETAYGVGDTIPVPPGRTLWLDTRAHDGRFSIKLFHGGLVCRPNPAKVRRRLDRLWAGQRRTYPLRPEYAKDYAVPVGDGADLHSYASVQDQFPAAYGIGHFGLPAGATTLRKAAAKQLKGYLMVYDQLMADYFSQLAFIRDLFSLTTGGDKTYASQSLRRLMPDSQELFVEGYDVLLQRLVAANDPVDQRQMAILDFLLSLYAETLMLPSNSSCGADEGSPPAQALLRAKRKLLTRIVPATRDRGRGFDYSVRAPADIEGRGLDVRCRIELSLLETGNSPQAAQAVDADEADYGRRLSPSEAAAVEDRFLPVEAHLIPDDDQDWDGIPNPLAGRRVAASLLEGLCDARRYRMGSLHGREPILLCAQATDGVWWALDDCADAAAAVALTNALVTAALDEAPRLHLVEWTLLRYARHHTSREPDDDLGDDPFSFRISAILPAERDDPDDDLIRGWRREARRIIRENMPAHIAVQDLFLGRRQMRRFRRLHAAWVAALREGAGPRRAEASWRLARFLNRCSAPQPSTEAPSTTQPDEASSDHGEDPPETPIEPSGGDDP